MRKTIILFISVFVCFNLFALPRNIIEQDLDQLNFLSASSLELNKEYQNKIDPIIQNLHLNKNYLLSHSEEQTLFSYYEKLYLLHFRLLQIYSIHNDVEITDDYGGESYLIAYSASSLLFASSIPLIRDSWGYPLVYKLLNEMVSSNVPEGSFFVLQNTIFKDYNIAFFLPESFMTYEIQNRVFYSNFLSQMSLFDYYGSEFYLKLKMLMGVLVNCDEQIIAANSFFKHVGNYEKQIFKASLNKPIGYYKKIFEQISTWIGDTKLKRIDKSIHYGKTLIAKEQLPQMKAKLLSGDILVSRGNWFLSNAFLPSFWPHAYLYLGTSEQLQNYFDDKEVDQFYVEKCRRQNIKCAGLIEYLKRSYPKAYNDYINADKLGHEKIVIEAISEGVVFSSAEGTLLADYIAAFRPNLTKLSKAQAVEEAFRYWGRAYDFDFDFRTPDKIVCSELVYRAYMPDIAANKLGITFNYDNGNGKYMKKFLTNVAMASGSIVQKYYDEKMSQNVVPELSFVFYMRGDEKSLTADFASENEMFKTILNSKYSVIYQN